ncbi:Phosphate acetyltransferase [Jeotgalibaca dankookensis]|uniref:Phosphate acetyltransferase n=1 Tax=Jeotgalibaca dankookensis TaxID=708126 RepID=A0A1S6IRQ7_9LACT|nr:phosphate acyltransferase [Jeotgalibaca dankookensis]AQS54228.1 Phosphate acetyltransferase [Jeotgalibaca dankookensis]
MITIAVANGSRSEMLEFVTRAHEKYSNEIKFIVFDTKQNIDSNNLWTYIQCETEKEMIHEAVKSVASNQAQILVKGIVSTHVLLKEVLREEHDLKKQGVLSHAALINLPQLNRPLLLADAGMNIEPSKEVLTGIIDNTVEVAFKIGLENPKVALLSAAENYNPKMPSSVMAKEVTDYYSNNKTAIIHGPISFDLALSKEAVAHKGFSGPIEGDADVIIVPNIDVGNALYKALVLFGGAITGGTIVGTKVPIVLTSRSDAIESKLYSLEFAIKQIKK